MNNGDNGPADGNNMLNLNIEVGENEDERMQSLIVSKEVEEVTQDEQTYAKLFLFIECFQ